MKTALLLLVFASVCFGQKQDTLKGADIIKWKTSESPVITIKSNPFERPKINFYGIVYNTENRETSFDDTFKNALDKHLMYLLKEYKEDYERRVDQCYEINRHSITYETDRTTGRTRRTYNNLEKWEIREKIIKANLFDFLDWLERRVR